MEKKENIDLLLSKIKKVDEKNVSVQHEKKYWGEAKNNIEVNMHSVSYPKELFYDKVYDGYIKVGRDSPISGMIIRKDSNNKVITCGYGYIDKQGKEIVYEDTTLKPDGEIGGQSVIYYSKGSTIPVDKSSPDEEDAHSIQGGDLSGNSYLGQFAIANINTKKPVAPKIGSMGYVVYHPEAMGLGQTQRALTRFLKKAKIQVSKPLVPIIVKGYQAPVFVPLDVSSGIPSTEGTGYMVMDDGKDNVKIQIFDWDRLKKEAKNEYSKLRLESDGKKEKDQNCNCF